MPTDRGNANRLPPRGIGNGQDNRLGRVPVFPENGTSLEHNFRTRVLGKVACPNGSYGQYNSFGSWGIPKTQMNSMVHRIHLGRLLCPKPLLLIIVKELSIFQDNLKTHQPVILAIAYSPCDVNGKHRGDPPT